jgi:hypothetical protein
MKTLTSYDKALNRLQAEQSSAKPRPVMLARLHANFIKELSADIKAHMAQPRRDYDNVINQL